MIQIHAQNPDLPVQRLCISLSFSRATLYRILYPKISSMVSRRVRRSPFRLKPDEEEKVLAFLHDNEFIDQAPDTIFTILLDRGTYCCSVRTMYRILERNKELRERRNQLQHPEYQKPELLATGSNQVWSWDITKLKGPVKWTYFYLYVVLDIFSRYVVGWLLTDTESSTFARQLLGESYHKHGIQPGQLTIHADRGSSMKSKSTAQFLGDLGVTRTHSRPQVSNDNPFSEAQFKTLKYRPRFPKRFGSMQDAREFCREFFQWYNLAHKHSGIAYLSPVEVHFGRAQEVLAIRQKTLDAAFAKNPNRFKNRRPMSADLLTEDLLYPNYPMRSG